MSVESFREVLKRSATTSKNDVLKKDASEINITVLDGGHEEFRKALVLKSNLFRLEEDLRGFITQVLAEREGASVGEEILLSLLLVVHRLEVEVISKRSLVDLTELLLDGVHNLEFC